jgi:hypothetical protein
VLAIKTARDRNKGYGSANEPVLEGVRNWGRTKILREDG